MDVIHLQVLCYDGLHLYEAPLSGLLFCYSVCGRRILAAQAGLH